jgi:LCP family protein required for cell wall assembly
VLSVGKDSKDAVMISIPRDTWIEIPKWDSFPGGAGKINSVYSVGDTHNYPDGGLALIKKVVSEKLDIPIHYALRIDFEGFKKTINTLDGIEVAVDKAFDDYRYPVEGRENASCSGGSFSCRFEHVHFEAGKQKMDGEKALQFVRSRTGTNGEGSDFARASRQQKVLIAARKKALSLGNLLNPSKVNSLFKDFGESVETDFSLNLYPAAYQLLKEVDASSTKKLVIDSSADGLLYPPDSAQYGGAYVLLPKGDSWDGVQKKVRSLLFPTSGDKQ